MNFLHGKISANGAAGFEGRAVCACRSASPPNGCSGRPAVYGVRPEHFTSPTTAPKPRSRWSSRPARRSRSSPSSAARTSSPCSASAIKFKPGDKIRLKPDPRLVHLFDEADGQTARTPEILQREEASHDDMNFTRRTFVKGATALAATGALTGTGPVRLGQGLGPSIALEGREGRQAHRDALEALRRGRGQGVQRDGRRLQGRDRHRHERVQRVVRGRAAEGFGRRQHRLGPGPRVGPAHAAAAVPRQGARR